jgi:hypothetical protein
MTRFFWICALLLSTPSWCRSQQSTATRSECEEEARRVLGSGVQLLRSGDFLHLGVIECLAVVAYSTSQDTVELKVRRGVLVEKQGSAWRILLRFESTIRNPQGYVGLDVIDPRYRFGFAVRLADERSDGTPGFTIYLIYLNQKLKPEGLPVEVSWNRKVSRFQEYAPNELDPPDYKPEIANPPVFKP